MTGRARTRDLRLLPVAASAWGAGAAATMLPEAATVIAAVLWLLALGAVAAGFRRRGAPIALVAVALVVAAAVASHVAMAQATREHAAALPISGGRTLAVEATVTGKVERSIAGWRFDAVTAHLTVGGRDDIVSVPVVVRTGERPADLDLGSVVEIRGSAFPADAGERAVLIVDADRLRVRRSPVGFLGIAADLRAALLDTASTLPQPGAGLIAGLAVGETSLLDDDLDADMKTASLSHLTAVSGANCALVIGIAYALAGMSGLRRGARVAFGLGTLIGFVVLVSPEPSVVRAAAMAAVAMLAVLLGRAGAGVAVLALAVTVCLVADPWLSTSLGFALSAVATASLLLAAAPITETFSRALPRPLALVLAVPTAAQLACTPLIVVVDPRVSLAGVLANVLAAPAAPVATVLGLAACLAAPVPAIAAGLAALAWLPCAWIAATAETIAAAPGSALPWASGWVGVAAAAVVCAATMVVLLPRSPRGARIVAGVVVAAVAGVGAGSAVVDGIVGRTGHPEAWAIAACDVGQGDAVLLRSVDRTALVDTGPEPAALEECLDRFGVDRVDLLVLTHFDLDHRGGVEAVISRTAMLLHGPPDGDDDRALLEAFRAAGADVVAAETGMSGTLGDAQWRVLWPRARSAAFPPGNDASVVLDVRGGGIPSILLLGDLSAAPQQSLGAQVHGPYDVVKVAHHGSADQSDDLYRRAAPRVALVTVGENDYGHPRAEILDLVRSLGTTVVRTDTTGAAAIVIRDGAMEIWRERTPTGVGPAG